MLLAGALATVILQPVERGNAQSAPKRDGGGNAARGEQLFATLPCASCHDVTHPWPGGDVCPNLGNIATEAARIVRSREYHGKARTAAAYIRESILEPNAYIVPGAQYQTAPGQSVMPKDFATTLKPAQVDDLVAFLMTKR
ncbi:MAG TPA: cytochrome c [Methylomirabilota bacterium]|nr:cytochrome c [Methylomirabilota bacterium]